MTYPGDIVKVNQEITVQIIGLDAERKRVGLSLRQVPEHLQKMVPIVDDNEEIPTSEITEEDSSNAALDGEEDAIVTSQETSPDARLVDADDPSETFFDESDTTAGIEEHPSSDLTTLDAANAGQIDSVDLGHDATSSEPSINGDISQDTSTDTVASIASDLESEAESDG